MWSYCNTYKQTKQEYKYSHFYHSLSLDRRRGANAAHPLALRFAAKTFAQTQRKIQNNRATVDLRGKTNNNKKENSWKK